ncbi:MAG: hypothetical protein KF841_13270 [Phycisphaerae bacterium]|nr:hypothetical protein [Phycisphaerae bacterium]
MPERPQNNAAKPESTERFVPASIGDPNVQAAPRRLDILLTADGTIDASSVRSSKPSSEEGRPWIGVHFECCGVYSRVYRERSADRYDGRCPKCGISLTVRVSPDGVSTSFVRARVT